MWQPIMIVYARETLEVEHAKPAG